MSLPNNNNRRTSSRVRLPLWAALGVFTLVAIILIGTGFLLYRTVRNLVADNGVTVVDPEFLETQLVETQEEQQAPLVLNQPSIIVTNAAGEEIEVTSTPEPRLSFSEFGEWDGIERVNVLMLGIDSRCDEEGPVRTDSMMLISIDPVGKGMSLLSLPRDLWVEIPAFGLDRINKANYLGEINAYPGGGPTLATETVEAFLGIRVDHFITVNFEAFRDFINLIDGIQIDVPEAINDPNYPDECYGYDPFVMGTGVKSMNGPIALKYARTRATTNGDIDRAERQQAVILAVRQKILDVNMIPKLITRSPQLWRTFQDNVSTSFSETEVIQLGLLVQDIYRPNIRSGVIDFNYVYNETTPDGQQVLVPRYEEIRRLREELFPPVEPPPQVIENLPALVGEEGARVMVYNGTQTFGLAGETQAYLLDQGVNVVDVGNADSSIVPSTVVIDYGKHSYTTLYLAQLMGLPPLNVSSGDSPEGDYDVLIILGNGWEVPEASE
ncbi:MAG: LCP family protein [Candidatus Promineifilaceae bacterium]